MMRHTARAALALAACVAFGPVATFGQGPTLPDSSGGSPGGNQSMLGTSPGSGGGGFDSSPGNQQGTLGGRPGASTSRAPSSITTPVGTNAGMSTGRVIQAPASLANADIPVMGSLEFPNITDDPGPIDGMTLEAAIERLVRENIYLRAVSFELPMAEADILTASLRANPVFYADAQLVPYGAYSRARPGGQTQYDVNISYPLDVSFKRKARIVSSSRAKQVLEQQYRDAVRLQIDNLYTVYVDVLAARATLRFSNASVEGLDTFLVPMERKLAVGAEIKSEVLKVRLQKRLADLTRKDAEASLLKAKRSLATLLNISPDQAQRLDLNSPLRDLAPEAAAEEVLLQIAVQARPDLIANRLGLARAEADVKLALANRFQDVYVLYQPYTLQDNTPSGLKSPSSWALGVTVPIPIYNRNQGQIMRSRLNVGQTRTQIDQAMRQVITDVQSADREYRITREAAEQFDRELKPYAEEILDTARAKYKLESENKLQFLTARNDYVAVVKQYLDVLVRHRRAMLDLNTAVGQRILP